MNLPLNSNQLRILFYTGGFLAGVGVGLFIRDVLLWQRKEEGYLKEIYREILELKLELSVIENRFNDNSLNISKTNKEYEDADWETDIFEDALDTNENASFMTCSEGFSNDLSYFILEFDENFKQEQFSTCSSCYEVCRSLSWKYQDFGEFLWRYAMAAQLTTITDEMKEEEKKERLFTALDNAKKAVQKLPKSSDAHKWLGVLHGAVGLYGSIKTKIRSGHMFMNYIDKCILLNPDDAYAYLLRGRFCYKVYNLSFFERRIAATLFEEPPSATIDDAIDFFLKCENQKPNFYASNHYYLHLCYKAKGDYTESIKWLNSAKTIPLTIFDSEVKLELSRL